MNFSRIPLFALATVFAAAPALVHADDGELDEAEIFFELNDTDGDLGIHGFADGDPWKELEIEGPNDRELMNIDVRSRLKRQGVTELFFESAEPTFDELPPRRFFRRFPQGVYEIEVETLEGYELESEIFLSHKIPAAPVVASVGGAAEPEEEGECWGLISDAVDVVVDWEPVMKSHKRLGTPKDAPLGDNVVVNYEFVAEIDGTDLKSSTIVSPETTVWTIPGEFIALAEGVEVEDDGEVELVSEIKFEILVRVDNGDGNPGNKSAVESCFETDINGVDDDS